VNSHTAIDPARKLSLLIVDDEPASMRALCDTLEYEGYQTYGHTSAADALAAMRERTFDLLLADLQMPGTNGIDLMKSAQLIDPTLVAVIMTGHGALETAVAAMKAGALDYIQKPIKLATALPVLERALAVRQLRIEKKRLEESVRERTEELKIANRELEAFSHSVSHDLRAPLRRILGFSEALAQGAGALDGEARALAERIAAVATHMDRLVTGLLGLSTAGREAISRQRVDLARLARASFEALRRAEPHRDASLTVHGPLVACADAGLVQAVIDNLIGNAWKFTSRRGGAVIEVGSRERGDTCEYYVRDNGAGFDPRHAAKLFRPFQRLHYAREFEGTGIGLATVRRIVARHGGEVGAEGSIGGGCTVWFTLPPE
jgi:signal transduction histidine kinase